MFTSSAELSPAPRDRDSEVAGEVLQKMLQNRKDLLVSLTELLPIGNSGVKVRRDEIVVATKAACQWHVGGKTKDGND